VVSGWLVDTNVLSAFGPDRQPPDAAVGNWMEDHTDQLFTCSVTAAEISTGIAKLRRLGAALRAERLKNWFERVLVLYGDRVLPLDLAAARIAGDLSDAATAIGRHPGFPDIAIAAIARAHGLVVLTANHRHFEPLGIETLNPLDLV
jgi:toxin FitB